jgi:hypothetical protein
MHSSHGRIIHSPIYYKMNTQTIRSWCIDNNDFALPNTHTFLDGGKASIPEAKLPDFLHICARHAFNGTDYAIVERYGDKFRLFIDIDLAIRGVHPGEEYMLALATAIDKLVRLYVAGPVGRCIVSRPDEDPLTGKGHKIGMHLNWHDVICTKAQAMEIRSLVIQGLARDAAINRPDTYWSKIIDSAVFKNGGLRPMWSKKYSNCPACTTAADHKDCMICVKGKYYDRPYIPVATISEDAVLGPAPPMATVEDYLAILQETTIQCPADSAIIQKNILPGWVDPAFKEAYNDPHVRAHMSQEAAEYQSITRGVHKKQPIDPADDRFQAFQDAVRMGWRSGAYKTIHLTKVDLKDNGQLLAMSNSTHCHIARRRHKSNHVWFRADIEHPRVIYQFCHDDDCRAAKGANTVKVPGTVWKRMYPPDYVPANLKSRKRHRAKQVAKHGHKLSKVERLLPSTYARR